MTYDEAELVRLHRPIATTLFGPDALLGSDRLLKTDIQTFAKNVVIATWERFRKNWHLERLCLSTLNDTLVKRLEGVSYYIAYIFIYCYN